MAVKWNLGIDLGDRNGGDGDFAPGGMLSGARSTDAAVYAVQKQFAELPLPSTPSFRATRVERRQGHGTHAISEGRVDVQVTLTSVSGPRHYVTVPVTIRGGRVLEPSVMLHQGSERIISKDSVAEILEHGEFRAKRPERLNMYSVPNQSDSPGARETDERPLYVRHPGMFVVVPSRSLVGSALSGVRTPRRAARRAFYEKNVVGDIGVTGPEVPRADGSHLDPAERSQEGRLYPTQCVATVCEFEARDRGGAAWPVPKGCDGVVERDVDGTGFAYVVRFDACGFSCTVPAWALKARSRK